jgi:photosystem II stability/assembly factor-like uncharacterized protein
MVPSATRHWSGILRDDWAQIEFGDGMYHQPDPASHRYIYSNANDGRLTRVDAETGDILAIKPYPPAGEEEYRFDWETPTFLSRHDPNVIYLGGNRLFTSRDRGVSWERTDDLSRRIDRDTLSIMDVPGADITLSKNDGTGSFGEIVTIAESPLDRNVLWVGTDDGNLQVSRDGGATWTEVGQNVAGVPDGTYVSRVIASVTGRGVAYATFDAHREGDFAPYVFRTGDFGGTWESLARGLPSGSVNVIREHPGNPNLLFLGTEHALFASGDAGANWVRFESNLPTTLYDDLVIHPRDDDLVVATHGRGIWILDDLTPLVEWSAEVADAAAHLFTIQAATIFQFRKDDMYRGNHEFVGENPPFGAVISYFLGNTAPSVRVTVANGQGAPVRTLEGPSSPGIHRVVWDLRHEPPPYEAALALVEVGDPPLPGPPGVLPHPVTPRGPFVAPGSYRVTLEAGSARITHDVVVRPDPRMPTLAQGDYEERERFLVELLALQQRAFDALGRAEALDEQVEGVGLDHLETLLRDIYGLAAEFNGNGVRPGSLYPPTQTHRQRYTALESVLAEAVESLSQEELPAGGAG